jgi:poly(A) polymerase
MIRKLIGRLLGTGKSQGKAVPAAQDAQAAQTTPLGKRVDVPVAEHGINPALLDDRAVKVVATLKDAGHEAYIVGGAVRDLLVGLRPKDFDVATSATPEQVKSLFRRAFIIGRRFRIVHVVFGRGREHEVIEVSTFRAYLDASQATAVDGDERNTKAELAGQAHAVDASGRVLRDNVWGPQIEDAARRDFTVNAMYYDPITQTVVDYHQGLADVRARTLRMIGNPELRYREDPVRIVRAVRFAAKLGFEIEPRTFKPIAAATKLMDNVPPSRLFDEMVKLMQTGHALKSVATLRAMKLTPMFPLLDAVFGDKAELTASSQRFIDLALQDTDHRVAEDRAVAPSFLLASLLWDEVRARWEHAKAGAHPIPALQEAIDTVFDARIGDISGRGKLGADMREIWMMQPRFDRRSGSGPYSLIEQPRFRAGYDFLRLRADAGEVDVELADWWEDFSLGSRDEQDALIVAARERSGAQAPRRVSKPKAAAPAAVSSTIDGRGSSSEQPGYDEPRTNEPRNDALGEDNGPKRRRRRRKPRSTSGGEGASAPPAGRDD